MDIKLKNMKKFFCFVFLLLAFTPLFSSGVMTGLHHKRVIQTQYFDIIYASGSEKSASIVAEHIDSMYESLCTQFGTKAWSHFPVTITSSFDELNAYFTSAPYNRIVLYDTLPGESLSVFSNTLLSVLYHEMTHAVTYNLKNKNWEVIGKVFGDVVSPAFINVPSSVAEGAAVTMESAVTENEGRMNSGFSTHLVRQAKIDGDFPSWQNVTGARDIYPIGEMPYIFGGMFFTYLRNTYGQEKFSAYWRFLVNDFVSGFYYSAFEDIFGLSLDEAWNDWKSSIQVPSVVVQPESVDGIEPFSSDKTISKKLLGQLFTSLTSCTKSDAPYVAWIDSSDDSVWLCDCSSDSPVMKKVLTLAGISAIEFSTDGKYLALSYVDSAYKSHAGIYNIQTGKITFAREEGLRSSCIVRNSSGKPYFCAVYTKNQDACIRLYELTEKKSSVRISRSPVKEIPFVLSQEALLAGRTFMPFSLTDCGNGFLSFICKNGMDFSLCLYNVETSESKSFFLPEEYRASMQIQALSGITPEEFTGGQEGVLLSFSYALPSSLPRLGFFALKGGLSDADAVWYLQDGDVSGGVYCPVASPYSQSLKLPSVMYAACFFESKKLYVASGDKINFDVFPAESFTENFEGDVRSGIEVSDSILKNSKKYNPFAYCTDGILFPFGMVSFYDVDFEIPGSALLGATYLTSNPWGGINLTFSGGYNNSEKSGGAALLISGSNGSPSFVYSLQGSAVFDSDGLYQTTGIGTISSSLQAGLHSKIIFSDTAKILRGHSFDSSNTDFMDSLEWISSMNNAGVTFSTVRQIGRGFYSTGGVFAGPFIKSEYLECTSFSGSDSYNNLGFESGFKVPKLIPINNPSDFTVNQPFGLTCKLFPKAGSFFSEQADLVLFSYEMQNGTKKLFLPFYVQRLSLQGNYSGSCKYSNYDSWDIQNFPELKGDFLNDEMNYYDKIGLSADVYFSCNTGFLASSPICLRFSASYALRVEPGKDRWNAGITGIVSGF